MANELIIKNGFFSQGDSDVTGSLQVSGSIGVTGSGSAVLSVYGSQGNLLVVTDSFSGSLFTVTDISGYPLLDVSSGSVDIVNPVIVTGSLAVNNGSNVLDTSQYLLEDGSPSINWSSRILSNGNESSIDWANRFLIDSSNVTTVDWGNRVLYASGGSSQIDWSNPSYISLPSISESSITNILGIDGSGRLYYTASSAIGGGGGPAFPYTGSAIITGSLTVTGSITLGEGRYGKIYDNGSQILFEANRPFISGGNTATIKSTTIDITGSNINVIGQLTHLALTSSFKPFYDPSYVLYRTEAGTVYAALPPGDGRYAFPSVIARNTAGGSVVTGTTSNLVSISSSLTLGAISTGSIYRVKALVTKTGTAGSTVINLYNSDSNGENQTNFLGHYTMSAGELYTQFERTFIVSSSAQTIMFPTASSAINDMTSSNTTPTVQSVRYNPFGGGQNQFMSIFLKNSNTGDSSVVRYITVETL